MSDMKISTATIFMNQTHLRTLIICKKQVLTIKLQSKCTSTESIMIEIQTSLQETKFLKGLNIDQSLFSTIKSSPNLKNLSKSQKVNLKIKISQADSFHKIRVFDASTASKLDTQVAIARMKLSPNFANTAVLDLTKFTSLAQCIFVSDATKQVIELLIALCKFWRVPNAETVDMES